eukprot:scaffold191391_cov24-Prasinocladus_malaysianus.AAC.1
MIIGQVGEFNLKYNFVLAGMPGDGDQKKPALPAEADRVRDIGYGPARRGVESHQELQPRPGRRDSRSCRLDHAVRRRYSPRRHRVQREHPHRSEE